MKRILMLATVVLLLALSAGTALAQSGYDLFQKALVKERAIGDVEEALRLYQRIVKEFSGDHALAAKAQLRMGLLYDRLGRKADAQRAYQAVVNQYADQTNEVRQARAKIVIAAPPPRNIKASAKTATGLTARQVWGDASGWSAAISPDGRHLAYVDPSHALYVRDIVKGENRRLTIVGMAWGMGSVTSRPVFSPDGKLIAYGWDDTAPTDLRLIALDGSAPRVLYHNDEGTELQPFDWSSDGKLILATLSGQNGSHQIVLVSVADGSMRVLKRFEWGFPMGMSLSPDGHYVAYDWQARKDSPEHDIFILATEADREVPVVTQEADHALPVWTPDGKGLVFLSRRAGYGPEFLTAIKAWLLRVVDGTPQGSPELIKDMGWAIPMGFTRNGSFYYTLRSVVSDLYVASLDPTIGTIAAQPATVTQRYVTNDGGAWSPNGQYLAYGSRRPSVQGEPGALIIVIRSVQTGEEYELAPAVKSFDVRGWSPDSRSLLIDATDKEGRLGLFLVDARTGDVAPLLYNKPGEHLSYPNWFANGKSIVFISQDKEGSTIAIVLRDLETGLETELYRPPAPIWLGDSMEVSADGQRLAFYLRDPKARTSSVMVIPAPGQKPRELGPRVKWPEVIGDIMALTPDGRQVLFTTYGREQEHRQHKLWRIAVEGGAPQEIALPIDKLGYPDSIRFHPDGKRIAFTTYKSKTTVWVMDNFLPAAQTTKATTSRR